ncbi:hypothetical protein FNV43_RR17189 [Rhamnella rubrinervis]|uniref:Uncharacterized protein n=1 Tax=Rhamnella rubrinervis TaxID=2594499 RepID=A0A8K0E357_9ROSA|nr:hypothetical protein FNV43_RR17189 [Rhamnella rubrinervis]
MGDNTSASMVINYSRFPNLFSRESGASTVKMANIDVLTGQNGEIRKNFVRVVMTALTAAWITCAVTTSVKWVFFICGLGLSLSWM